MFPYSMEGPEAYVALVSNSWS